jgi:hypothetical protein
LRVEVAYVEVVKLKVLKEYSSKCVIECKCCFHAGLLLLDFHVLGEEVNPPNPQVFKINQAVVNLALLGPPLHPTSSVRSVEINWPAA